MLWTALLDKIYIFLTLYVFHSKAKNNKLKKIELISNKSSKLRKLSFANNLSEKRLLEFAQTHFIQLKTPITSQYWIKLTGISYEGKI